MGAKSAKEIADTLNELLDKVVDQCGDEKVLHYVITPGSRGMGGPLSWGGEKHWGVAAHQLIGYQFAEHLAEHHDGWELVDGLFGQDALPGHVSSVWVEEMSPRPNTQEHPTRTRLSGITPNSQMTRRDVGESINQPV